LLAPVWGVVAWRLPSFVRGRASRRRRARADAELPQLLDLLAAASSAGLSAPLSLRRAVGALEGPLAEELHGVLQAVELGGRWRDELRFVAERLGLPDLRRTVAALTRTETLGSSLATSMQDLAERVRASRRAAVTERARTAPVKMLFPLVFLVLPAFLLLTVVPVLLTTLQSIR
jgi:tight adherence protein C